MENKNEYQDESTYKKCVTGLTLKYVDILIVIKSPKRADKFLLGRRKESAAKEIFWLAGGRSKKFVPYQDRAKELVAEDFNITVSSGKLKLVGFARLHCKSSRFDTYQERYEQDGDISIFALEISDKEKFGSGIFINETKIFEENEARKQHEYVNYAIDCYNYLKKNGTPNPWPREIAVE